MPRMWSLIMLSLLCACAIGGLCGCKEYYVATNGSDAWSGTLAEPNKAGTDGPFATLERARDTIRELKSKHRPLKEPVMVYIRKGTYYLDRPFTLGPDDSGTREAPIIYTAAPGEEVVISGGKPIVGFREVEVNGHKMIAADLPEVKDGSWNFTQLFVNSRRRPRTRLPKDGYYQVASLPEVKPETQWNEGQTMFKFNPGEIRAWRNLSDIDIVSLQLWVESRMPIKSVDEASQTVELAKRSVFWLRDDGHGARYSIENVFEALDTPGQWYVDRPSGVLYYYPILGEDTKRATFAAPRLERVVKVVGEPKAGRKVECVGFSNLHFAHTQYNLPADSAGASQAAVGVPGAIHFENASNCGIVNCEVSRIGGYAVEVAGGCSDIAVNANRITDMGAGGVKINPGSEKVSVTNNDIGDGGKIFMSAIGVWIGNSPNNHVAHNHIHDLNYTGVSVGWTWGYGPSKATGNIIEYNHIDHIGREVLSDLGGIYSLGTSPGTILRNNLIHDCYSHSYGGWGIYTDEGSSNMLIENNVVYNTKTGGFHQHYGKENTVRNNVFAFATVQQLQRTRPEPHLVYTFDHNIVYFDKGDLLGGGGWSDDKQKMDYNTYWNTSGPVSFAGGTLEDWRKRGHDANSVIADPLFVNPARFDFRLKPGSPALKLGFRPIDLSSVGPVDTVGPEE